MKRYLAALNEFIELHSGVKQHDPQWYLSMALTCGGSEAASVMDINPYMTFRDVVESKIKRLEGDTSWDGGEACFWGTLWEDVNAACVAVDLGCEVVGDTICIMHSPGVRYSPDGYTVARFYLDEKRKLRLWTTDMDKNIPVILIPVLLELKCPLTRKPKPTVPMYYRPQVQSGLVASPAALYGLYVEAVIRKCAISDMGPNPAYDTAYHRFDLVASPVAHDDWVCGADGAEAKDSSDSEEEPQGHKGLPLAWGIVYVYAPRMSAPRGVRMGWKGEDWAPGDPTSDGPNADAAHAAQSIYRKYYGVGPSSGFAQEAADLGEVDAKTFVRTLELIDQKRFKVRRGPPCFADGRGAQLHTGNQVRRALDEAAEAAPEHYWLMGILPWKLFSLDYHTAKREPGFESMIQPLID